VLQQVIANGIVAAAVYALVGMGFGLVLSVGRFFHFSHAAVFSSGAYFCYLYRSILHLPIEFAIALALASTVALGIAIEIALYRPLRRRRATPLVFLMASLGAYIVLQNLISLLFGDGARAIRSGQVATGVALWGVRLTTVQLTIVAVSAILLVGTIGFLRLSKVGQALRAVANDSELAAVSGIGTTGVLLWCLGLASFLAGVAGILVALDVDMTPTMGMPALMVGMVAVIIGGRRSPAGVIAGALVLGLAQHLCAWQVGSRWQDGVAFLLLLVFLLWRPEGLFGGKATRTAH